MSAQFTQYVFFLSTAEEEAAVFVGQERSTAPPKLRYARDLRPGTYRVEGEEVQPVEVGPEQKEAPEGVTGAVASWCTGRVDMP